MNANLIRTAIVSISCLFAVPSWSDETANAANGVAVASAHGVETHQRVASGHVAAKATDTAVAARPQRQPPAGVEVVRVQSERSDCSPDETKDGAC